MRRGIPAGVVSLVSILIVVAILVVPTSGGVLDHLSAAAPPARLSGDAAIFAAKVGNSTSSLGTGLTNTWGIALDSKTGYLFVTDGGGQDVAAINGATGSLVSDIKVESGAIDPAGIAYDPVHDNVYVCDMAGGDVSVIGGTNLTVWKHIGIGTAPDSAWGAFFDPAANEVLVSYDANHALTAISTTTNSVAGNFSVGNGFSPTGGSAFGWTYDSYSGQVFVGGHPLELLALDGARPWITTNISVTGTPTGIAYDAKTGIVFDSTTPWDEVNGTNDTSFGTFSSPNSTGCGGFSCSMAYDSGDNQLYLETGSSIQDFNAATGAEFGSIPAGGYQMIYDSLNQNLYVTTEGTSITEVHAGPSTVRYAATFTTQLPPGLSWSVKIGTLTSPSTSDSVLISEKPGAYKYTVNPPAGYSATPATGTVNLKSGNLSVAITLTAKATYSVTFAQSGLPSGFAWSVSVNGAGTRYGTSSTSSGSSLTLKLPNGDWGYSESVPSGYSVYPTGGEVTVSGASPATQQVFVAPELNIGVGAGDDGVAYSAPTGLTFTSNLYSNNVTVVNDTFDQVVKSIAVGTDPEAVLTESYNPSVYVANSFSNNITVINATTLTTVGSIPVGSSPSFLYFDPVADEVFVSNSGTTSVTAIYVRNNTVAATISVAGTPQWITEDTTTGDLYVENAASCGTGTCHPVSVISDSTDKVVATVPSSSASGAYNFLGGPSIAYDPSNGDVYLLGGFYLYVLSTTNNSIFRALALGSATYGGLLYDPLSGDMLVSGPNQSVSVVSSSTNTVAKQVAMPSNPGAMLYDALAGAIYVADTGGRAVTELNASTESAVATITTDYTPTALALDPVRSSLYVDCWSNDALSVVFPPRTFPVASFPTISNVTTFTTTTTATVTITGTGFGVDPQTYGLSDGSVDTVQSPTSPSLVIADSGGGVHNWSAGRATSTNPPDAIGVFLASWSDTSIVLHGFGTQLGRNWSISAGDPLLVRVYGPNQDGMAVYTTTVSTAASVVVNHTTVTELHVFGVTPSGSVPVIAPADGALPNPCTCALQNLSALSAVTVTRGAAELIARSGTLSSTRSKGELLNFTMSNSNGTLVAFDLLAYNQSIGRYVWSLTMFFFPTSGSYLHLGDSFADFGNATLNQSIGQVGSALGAAGRSYLASTNVELVLLGANYVAAASDLGQFQLMLPSNVSSLRVAFGSGQVIDPKVWDWGSTQFTCETTTDFLQSVDGFVDATFDPILAGYQVLAGLELTPAAALIDTGVAGLAIGGVVGSTICDFIPV